MMVKFVTGEVLLLQISTTNPDENGVTQYVKCVVGCGQMRQFMNKRKHHCALFSRTLVSAAATLAPDHTQHPRTALS